MKIFLIIALGVSLAGCSVGIAAEGGSSGVGIGIGTGIRF